MSSREIMDEAARAASAAATRAIGVVVARTIAERMPAGFVLLIATADEEAPRMVTNMTPMGARVLMKRALR